MLAAIQTQFHVHSEQIRLVLALNTSTGAEQRKKKKKLSKEREREKNPMVAGIAAEIPKFNFVCNCNNRFRCKTSGRTTETKSPGEVEKEQF